MTQKEQNFFVISVLYLALAVTIFALCFTPLTVHAEIDAPIIKTWQDGKPYDTDGDAILDSEYFPEGWCLDISSNPDGVYEYINSDGSVKETMSVDEFLKKYDDTYKEGGENVSASSESSDTGVINFAATVPDDVNGTDVIVGIQNEKGDAYKIRLYAKNNYQQTEFVKPGTYTITSANLDGDTAMQYQAKYSSDMQEVTRGGSGSFDLDFTGQAKLQKESESGSKVLTNSSLAKRILLFVTIVTISVAVGVVIWILYKRYKINKGY